MESDIKQRKIRKSNIYIARHATIYFIYDNKRHYAINFICGYVSTTINLMHVAHL